MKLIQCSADVITGSLGEPLCLDGATPVAWEVWDWGLASLDPATASLAFGAGAFVALAFWVVASGMVLLIRSLGIILR